MDGVADPRTRADQLARGDHLTERGGPTLRESGPPRPAGTARRALRERRRSRILDGMPSLPPPGPSFLREQTVRIGDRTFRVGMARPTEAPDGWWLAVLWVVDGDGVIAFRDLAPAAGPPPDPPLGRLGPAVSGALSGLILEDAGRLQLRLGLIRPPDDPARPWLAPAAIRAAFRFEPARAAAMRANELAETVLAGFCQAFERLHRP